MATPVRCGEVGRPVSRVLSGGRSPDPVDGHSSGPAVADGFSRSTRTAGRRRPICGPYTILLPAGLAMPPPSPGARWALTPPFHPCRPLARPAVCFLWRFPSDPAHGFPRPEPGRALPGAVSPWSPDFPRPHGRPRRRDHPAAQRLIIAAGRGGGKHGFFSARTVKLWHSALRGDDERLLSPGEANSAARRRVWNGSWLWKRSDHPPRLRARTQG